MDRDRAISVLAQYLLSARRLFLVAVSIYVLWGARDMYRPTEVAFCTIGPTPRKKGPR